MPATVNGIAFLVFAFALIFGALAIMSSRNILHAAFWLLEVAVASAGLFYFLSADYIALMQLMVYAGAVGVLIVFTIMITARRREDLERSIDFSLVGLIVALAFFGAIAYAIFTSPSFEAVSLPASAPILAEFGKQLFSIEGYALPFEIASLILTVSLVAAIWWTRGSEKKCK